MPGLHFFDRGFLAFAMTCGIVECVRGIDGVLKGYVFLASSSRLSSRYISSSAGNSMVLNICLRIHYLLRCLFPQPFLPFQFCPLGYPRVDVIMRPPTCLFFLVDVGS
jgi:hypothetical protein